MSRGLLIFSGYNQRAVISFCRYAILRNILFKIVARDKNDTILKSKYANYVLQIRKSSKLSYTEIVDMADLAKYRLNTSSILILPSTEYLNRILIRNSKDLKKHNIFHGLCRKKIYETISDKFSFGKLCSDFNIKTPRILKETANYPIVIKSKRYFSSKNQIVKPVIINTEKEKNKFLKDKNIADFYFQEFIEGKSIYLLFFVSKDSFKVFSQENLMQEAGGGSILLSRSAKYHEHPVAHKYGFLFLNIGFTGLVMVELRMRENDFFMIEANPRLWGPSQLILDAGMDLFDQFAITNHLINSYQKDYSYKTGVSYFWEGGISKSLVKPITFTQPLDDLLEKIEVLRTYEVYNREDTCAIYNMENEPNHQFHLLEKLYQETSKHSNYQVLPAALEKLLPKRNLKIRSRYEKERLNFIAKTIEFKNKKVLDVGGNTGFFTFESLALGASETEYIEGNKNHSDFVQLASELTNSKIKINNKYLEFREEEFDSKFDIIFLLNVIHHLGDDFAQTTKDINTAKQKMINAINFFNTRTEYLILQMGYCWKGDISQLLFKNGTKKEMIEFIKDAIKDKWELFSIGIAEKKEFGINYTNVNNDNINRMDELGEFLNRPIFILKSKR